MITAYAPYATSVTITESQWLPQAACASYAFVLTCVGLAWCLSCSQEHGKVMQSAAGFGGMAHLHAETYAQVWFVIQACKACSTDLPLYTACAKATGNQDAVCASHQVPSVCTALFPLRNLSRRFLSGLHKPLHVYTCF